mgnify:CR=1 FL=1
MIDMTWKDIIKAQLAILDREDARDLMRQYRGKQAKALGKNIALIQQNLPDVVKEFKIMMDNPVKGYDGIPSYNTVDATANIILVIDYKQMNWNINSNKFGGYDESYYGLDSTLEELFRGNPLSFRNPLSSTSEGGVRNRKRKDTFTEKGEIVSYQKTFPFKVEFDASKPMLFGAEKLIDFLDELEDLLDREVSP